MVKKLAWCVAALVMGACVVVGAETSSTQSGVVTTGGGEFTIMPEGCTIKKYTVRSEKMKRDIKVAVVLPPGYEASAEKRYPVLYTLHGMGAPYAGFSEMTPLRKSLKDRPMIVVSFDGDKMSWYLDAPKKPESQFTTFFFEELIPHIDKEYRTKASAEYRGVTGFSMGGHGGFHYMLSRPGVLGSVSTLSAVFSFDDNQKERRMKIITPLLGPYEENKEDYAKFRLYPRLEEHLKKGLGLPPIFIHCGTEDHLIDESRGMANFLMQANRERKQAGKPPIVFQYKESPGEHKWPFWRDASAGAADFHWRVFEAADAAAARAATQAATKPAN
jgi:S-formylglutathione hydrolase FrmB